MNVSITCIPVLRISDVVDQKMTNRFDRHVFLLIGVEIQGDSIQLARIVWQRVLLFDINFRQFVRRMIRFHVEDARVLASSMRNRRV